MRIKTVEIGTDEFLNGDGIKRRVSTIDIQITDVPMIKFDDILKQLDTQVNEEVSEAAKHLFNERRKQIVKYRPEFNAGKVAQTDYTLSSL